MISRGSVHLMFVPVMKLSNQLPFFYQGTVTTSSFSICYTLYTDHRTKLGWKTWDALTV